MAPGPVSESPARPGVTVVIPAYNYAQFLPQAIDSVLNQDYAPYEIVVVDDGSTDHTAAIVAGYGDRVRYLYQTNSGLAASRNTGVRAAHYDYVAFLDADDECLPAFLRRNMETYAQLPDDFAIVACSFNYVDRNGSVLHLKQLGPRQPREILCRDVIFRSHFPCTVVAKKAALIECGLFDATLPSSEDRDMWLRVAARWRIYFLGGEQLVRIRKHTANMSKQAGRMKATSRRVISKAYRSRLVPRWNVFFWLKVLSFHHFQTAWMYYEEGRRSQCIREILWSLLLWPCFLKPHHLNEPWFFRVRSLLVFCRKHVRRGFVTTSNVQPT